MNRIKKGLGAAALASAAALGAQQPAHALVDPQAVGDTTTGASYSQGRVHYQDRSYDLQPNTITADQAKSATMVKVRSKDIDKHSAQPTIYIALIGNKAFMIK